ncbi:hypothetical protein PG996_006470 [Apiospora saccharicola]|uniref:Uncharacterized protein n=1 Tax=Apiospora saccharicola TaxID=335842 RepID=A0ABR1VPP2_9PEZI
MKGSALPLLPMELDTVGGLITALMSTYDDGLECYTRWQHKEWQTNHYQGRSRGRLSGSSSGGCGLSTSLTVSGSRLRQIYDGGVDVLGDAFSTGDKQCRGTLQVNLELLQAQVEALYDAARHDHGPLLGLFEMLRASEAVRTLSLRALAEQYQRIAVGRLVPRELPMRQQPPARRTSALPPSAEAAADEGSLNPEISGLVSSDTGAGVGRGQGGTHEEDEGAGGDEGNQEDISAQTEASYETAKSSRSVFQSEPPSPPPTPKMVPDDLQSTCTSEFGPRPRASVFSVFCPEAMKYQVDLKKVIPLSSSLSSGSHGKKRKDTCCSRCGYRWNGTGNGGTRATATLLSNNSTRNKATATASTTIKDGFLLTPRFLGKSHCGTGGFGCVLCTSSGQTGVYDTVESLRDHINTSHDKWQMLHERDLVNR